MNTARAGGRAWPYAGLILGGGVSVAANIAHSYVPPTGAPVGWAPSPGAVLLAAFWPAAVFVAVEIMARATWADGRRWVLVRWGGLAPVALVAAVVSYRHLAGLLGYYGEDPVTVAIGPLAVDGLMIVSTGALLAGSTRIETEVDPATAETARSQLDSLDSLDRLDSIRSVDRVEHGGAPLGVEVEPIVRSAIGSPDLDPASGGSLDGRAVPARAAALAEPDMRSSSPAEVDYRAEDVERLKAAVIAGDIPWPIKYEPARRHLRINIKYVKAAAQQINDEGWTPGQQALIDA